MEIQQYLLLPTLVATKIELQKKKSTIEKKSIKYIEE
jgi:hypothetical protein